MKHASSSRLAGHGDLASSLVLIFPLLLIYEIGVLFAGRVNGADFVTRAVYAIAGSRAVYLAIYALVAVASSCGSGTPGGGAPCGSSSRGR